MKQLLLQDKKGVSIMVAYVLLIVLAIGLAGGVYSYLNFYVPKDQPQCPSDVSLIVQDVECTNGQITISLLNKGLFSIDGAYLKIGDPDRIARNNFCFNTKKLDDGGNCDVSFFGESIVGLGTVDEGGLKPGEVLKSTFTYEDYGNGDKRDLEVEPIVIGKENDWLICKEAVVTQIVTCYTGPGDNIGGAECGDGSCQAGEDENSCPVDCGVGLPVCGNHIVEPPEECEIGDSRTCTDGNNYQGSQSCDSCFWGECTATQSCGDGVKNGNEICDGSDLDGNSCVSLGFVGGTLGCNLLCDGFNTSQCNSGGGGPGGGGNPGGQDT